MLDIFNNIKTQKEQTSLNILKSFGTDIEKARAGIYSNTPENRRLHRVGQRYGTKKEERIKKRDWSQKDIINKLLDVSQPQQNAFIGAYSLCSDFKDWKEEMKDELEVEGVDSKTIEAFFKDFEGNVKGAIIEEEELFTDKESKDEKLDIKDKFDMETSYLVSKLPKGFVSPKGVSYFMLLPVDYNRGGMDIGIAYLTDRGKKVYSKYLTGDY